MIGAAHTQLDGVGLEGDCFGIAPPLVGASHAAGLIHIVDLDPMQAVELQPVELDMGDKHGTSYASGHTVGPYVDRRAMRLD